MKYTKLPFKTLIQPAIELAEKGFALTAAQAASFNNTKKEFLALNTTAVAFVKETAWKAGDILIQKDLANTLKRIRDNGFMKEKPPGLLLQKCRKEKVLFL